MKLLNKKIKIFLICAIISAGVSLSAKTYKLANGKTIVDPYVISKRPNGLEIGHKTGISFVKFELLPPEIQKRYGYSPEEARKYEENLAKKKKAELEAKKREAQKQAAFDKEMAKKRLAVSMERLQLDIVKTENRINFLKAEIPRLKEQSNDLLNKTTSMASTSVSGNSPSRRRRYDWDWDGGYSVYSRNLAGSKAETTKRRTISKIEDQYSITLNQIRRYEKELATKEIEILKMKSKLKRYHSQK